MKKLFFVYGLILALLFAPFVFGAELIQNAPDLGFSSKIINEYRPEIIKSDFAGSFQNSVIQNHAALIKLQTTQPRSVIIKSAGTNPGHRQPIEFQGAGDREGVGKSVIIFV